MTKYKKYLVAMVVSVLLTSVSVQAGISWIINSGDGDWNDTSKWVGGVLPGISDTAVFGYAQSTPVTVSLSNDVSANITLGLASTTQTPQYIFDLNGYTLTVPTALEAHRSLDWTIINGTLIAPATCSGISLAYHENLLTPKMTIGAGATFLHQGSSYMSIGFRTTAEFIVQDGGKLITDSAAQDQIRLGYKSYPTYADYTATMTITGAGSVWSNLQGRINLSTTSKATAELNITDSGKLVNEGTYLYIAYGPDTHASMNISSNGLYDHNASIFRVAYGVNAQAEVNITSGGVCDLLGATSYPVIGYTGSGTVTVSGSGSKFLPPLGQNFYFGYTDNASDGTLIIEDGGFCEKAGASKSISLGYRDGSAGEIIVRNGGTLNWTGGSAGVRVGTGIGSNGGITVTGTNSYALIGELNVAQSYSTGTVTVADGGTLEVFRTAYFGRQGTNNSSHTCFGKLVVTGEGSVLKKTELTAVELPDASMSAASSLGIGGSGFSGWTDDGLKYSSGYGPGGKGEAIIENGGLVDINNYLSIYSNSTIRIDGGHTQSKYIGMDTCAVFNVVLRQGDANGTALMTATTTVRLWGPTLVLELGSDFERVTGDVYTLISGSTIESSYDRLSYDGATLQDGAIIAIGNKRFEVNYSTTDITLTAMPPLGTVILVQ